MISPKDELTALITLTKIKGLSLAETKYLFNQVESVIDLFKYHNRLSELISGISPRLTEALDDPGSLLLAEKEVEFIYKNDIKCLTINDTDYPNRLRECDDAPLVLYYLGNANLNAKKIVSVVGSRKATDYGKEICNMFIRDLSSLCPDAIIVSGLAFGIDVEAHKASINHNLDTVGVLAHGLDRIYPSANRRIAKDMVLNGGLLTEFMSETIPFKMNFVRRNRIVAGISDAVVVVESAERGGSLITAELAEGYNRDCFAFPGNIFSLSSMGCNYLIRDNKASLITSAQDFINIMNWEVNSITKIGHEKQGSLIFDLSNEENKILNYMKLYPQGSHIDTLLSEFDLSIGKISSLLIEMEIKGVIKSLSGGLYKAII
ncbi:MAG TPA: DNA-processing protein DprA [Bacteroidaceae bacterium]|nr:DNA-processing protein DprA [Bacteroidaceae bacterium]